MIPNIVSTHPKLQPYLEGADHVDVKTFTSEKNMREFIAGMFSYHPSWLKTLYGIRKGFVRLLGMKQESMPDDARLQPEDVSFTPGEKTDFFTIVDAEEDHYYISGAKEKHLDAYLGLVVEPSTTDAQKQYHLITVVHYNHFTGPIYFNVIRPFHHLVVQAMGNAGAKQTQPLGAIA